MDKNDVINDLQNKISEHPEVYQAIALADAPHDNQ